MTSNFRGSGRTGRLVVALVVLGLLLGLAALLLVRLQNAPQLAAEPWRIDLGTLALGTTTSFEIRITNVGDSALRFQQPPNIEVLEGC